MTDERQSRQRTAGWRTSKRSGASHSSITTSGGATASRLSLLSHGYAALSRPEPMPLALAALAGCAISLTPAPAPWGSAAAAIASMRPAAAIGPNAACTAAQTDVPSAAVPRRRGSARRGTIASDRQPKRVHVRACDGERTQPYAAVRAMDYDEDDSNPPL